MKTLCKAVLLTIVAAAGLTALRPLALPAHAAPAAKASPSLKPAPAFTLQDAEGRQRSLAEFRGHPVAMFFYCGCPWCHRTAKLWGEFQRGGVLKQAPLADAAPMTLVVFSGDASGVKQFAAETGLAPDTVLLCDPQLDVTIEKYDAEPCPRAFVLDPSGRIVYTNNHADDAPRKAPEIVIASRTLDALRKAAPRPTSHP